MLVVDFLPHRCELLSHSLPRLNDSLRLRKHWDVARGLDRANIRCRDGIDAGGRLRSWLPERGEQLIDERPGLLQGFIVSVGNPLVRKRSICDTGHVERSADANEG